MFNSIINMPIIVEFYFGDQVMPGTRNIADAYFNVEITNPQPAASSSALRVLRRVKDHHHLLLDLPLLKKTCVNYAPGGRI